MFDFLQVVELIEKKERLPIPKDCPNLVYNLMLHCWNYEPQGRPTFLDLVSTFKSNLDYVNIKTYIK